MDIRGITMGLAVLAGIAGLATGFIRKRRKKAGAMTRKQGLAMGFASLGLYFLAFVLFRLSL